MKKSLFLAAFVAAAFGMASAVAQTVKDTVVDTARSVKDFAVDTARKAHDATMGYMATNGLVLFALLQTQHAKGIIPMATAMGQELVPLRAEISLTSNPAVNDVAEMLIIPPGLQPVDWVVDPDDMDTNGSPTLAFKLGVLNAGKTDLDTGNAIWKTGMTGGQTGTLARMDTLTAIRGGSSAAARSVGIVFTATAATFAAGKIGVTVYCKAAG